MIDVGSDAPDAQLTDIDGHDVRLSEYWSKSPIVLVFLRHLGCIFCREQVGMLRDRYSEFQAAGAEIVCVAQGDEKTGKAFSILMGLPYPILMCGELPPAPSLEKRGCDAFRDYGLARGTPGQLFGLASVLGGFRALFRGYSQGKVVGDGFQMPGVFVVDTGGIVRFVHRHRHAGDNPDTRRLLDAVGTLGV